MKKFLIKKWKKHKKLLIYIGRWQLSSIVLYPCVALIPLNPLLVVVISNLVGALIFYPVDKFIFKK